MSASITILYVLVTTAATSNGSATITRTYDSWLAQGDYADYPACISAVKTLKLSEREFKCIPTGRPSPKTQ